MKKQSLKILEILKDERGVSLVIALILTTVVMLQVLNMVSRTMKVVRFSGGAKGYAMASSAADSALEMGLVGTKSLGPGQDVGSQASPVTACIEIDPSSDNGAVLGDVDNCSGQLIEYWITSSAVDMDPSAGNERYIIPPPGEGDAGENCERLDNYDDPQQRLNVIGVEENIKKPCNWSKLYLGQSVEIPLYTTDAAGNVVNPLNLPDGFGSGLDSFTLKVRTPCADPMYDTDGYLRDTDSNGDAEEDEWCTNGSLSGPNARPELFDTTPGPGNPTDIIVHWQIIGNCDYSPNNSHDGVCVGMASTNDVTPYNPNDRSDINIQTINDGKEVASLYAVLGDASAMFPYLRRNFVYDLKTASLTPIREPQTVIDYLTDYDNDELQFDDTDERILTEPRLKLTVVSPMPTDSSGGQVSHIEYQLEVDQPIADSFWTVHGRGIFGNHSVTRKAKVGAPTSIINFVIQN